MQFYVAGRLTCAYLLLPGSVVTMTKSVATKGHNHWKCALKGQAVIDTSGFGVPITTINPHDPSALKGALQD